MPDGILIIDKPTDWTSMDVCAKLRGVFHEKRIGHGGTLDPMATGVLPVFIGRATRAVEFAEKADKEYIATLRPGIVTDTQDSTGRILEKHPGSISIQDLESVLPQFTGAISQIPPMYSAIKIDGKKLYQLARKGREIERPARSITIHELEIMDGPTENGEYSLRVRCSKGTYIRTLCHDIGQALGCGAVMSGLRRSMACGYSLAQSFTLEQVLQAEDPTALLLPIDSFFSVHPSLRISAAAEKKVRNGASVTIPDLADGVYRVYGPEGSFLALSQSTQTKVTTIKSFFNV